MIIPINIASSSSSSNPKLPPSLAKISHDEIVLIELQGSLEVECNHPSERDGKFIGKLTIDESTNKPTLLIGHHLLEGKIANLPKPLAVLHRSSPAAAKVGNGNAAEEDEHDDMDDDMADVADTRAQETVSIRTTVEWDVVAVVKRKIVFSKRPMPVVNLGTQHNP
ncbi:Chromosome transmission fidelity protein 8 [Hypsizygus marmoreus]|uniref:Chromosome transmission fidelity protein 8 n=1 Tax=Hypsizygus marmoreus TaxID=39966 RepID=A0A369JWG6_HYPMA|nr:Chromosome transmission fidelity protein 8 [Hypsizygus marmoreus]